MNNTRKAKLYIYGGQLLTVAAMLGIGWVIWATQISQLWKQREVQASFVTNTPAAWTATPLPTATKVPTVTPTPTLLPTETIAPTKPTETPLPSPTPIERFDYLLEIPSINLRWVVHHITPEEENDEPWGIPKALLDEYGIVDYPHLGYPGEAGLAAAAGHRDISGSPLWKIEKIKVGDQIIITRKDGKEVQYLVYKLVVVEPDDPVFWDTMFDNEFRLVSCLIGSTKQRVIVFAFQKD